MDQIYPFTLAEKKPLVINPRTGAPGLLELNVISEGVGGVYLFPGTLSQEECEQSINNETPTFSVAANPFHCGQVLWNGNEQTFTVFCSKAARGYVRISEIVQPHDLRP